MTIETRPLGRTGTDVTILGYGAMELRGEPRGPAIDDADAGRVLHAVLDGGINLIDTSVDYGRSEELIGRYLRDRREEYFLASKCGCPLDVPAAATPPCAHDYRPANVRADVEQSLRRLGTDRLDLVQGHMSPRRAPLEEEHTVQTPQDMRAFDALQIPYSAVQRDHEELIEQAAAGGAGTFIRGGAARGAPAEDK